MPLLPTVSMLAGRRDIFTVARSTTVNATVRRPSTRRWQLVVIPWLRVAVMLALVIRPRLVVEVTGSWFMSITELLIE